MELFDVYPLFDVTIVKGQGCRVWDDQGQEYLDLYGGHAVISVGHAHPRYVEAVSRQVATLGFYSNSVKNDLQVKLAHALGEACGYEDYRLFLVNSGAEANENAIKLASFHTGRKKVVALQKAFHGRTSAAVRITDNPKIVAPANEGMDVEFVPLNDIPALEKALSDRQACAFVMEGIMGVGGVHMANDTYFKAAERLCHETGTVFVMDEIQSGYGRSGRFFAHQYAGVRPDLITVAKGIANGYPMSGLLIAPSFEAVYGRLGTTFGGNHLGCAAAIAVLDIIREERLIENAARVGEHLLSECRRIPQIKEVRGKGLMIGLEFQEPVKTLRQNLIFKEHIFTGASGTNTIRLLPPLCLSLEQADHFITALKRQLALLS